MVIWGTMMLLYLRVSALQGDYNPYGGSHLLQIIHEFKNNIKDVMWEYVTSC